MKLTKCVVLEIKNIHIFKIESLYQNLIVFLFFGMFKNYFEHCIDMYFCPSEEYTFYTNTIQLYLE